MRPRTFFAATATVFALALALAGATGPATAQSPAQDWVVNNPRAVVVHRTTGMCLTGTGGAGSPVTTQGCRNAPGQQFVAEGGEIYQRTADLCLTAAASGGPATLRRCDGSAGQRFGVQGATIRQADGDRCLTATGAGRPVVLTRCTA
ncbi:MULTISPECIES: ricin-type beta-trefoil lectin domain protein [Streptomyces]